MLKDPDKFCFKFHTLENQKHSAARALVCQQELLSNGTCIYPSSYSAFLGQKKFTSKMTSWMICCAEEEGRQALTTEA